MFVSFSMPSMLFCEITSTALANVCSNDKRLFSHANNRLCELVLLFVLSSRIMWLIIFVCSVLGSCSVLCSAKRGSCGWASGSTASICSCIWTALSVLSFCSVSSWQTGSWTCSERNAVSAERNGVSSDWIAVLFSWNGVLFSLIAVCLFSDGWVAVLFGVTM